MPHPDLVAVQVSLSVILLLLLVLLLDRRVNSRIFVWSSITIVLVEAIFTSWVAVDLFQLWNDNPDCRLCQVHLPPYSNYWYEQSFWLYGKYFGINAATGVLFGLGFWLFARRTKGRVIDRDDVFLLTLAGMMTGWPNILLFLGALFVLGTAVWALKRLLRNRVTNPNVIITPLIPFAAIPIILWGDQLARLLHFYDLGLVALTLY